MTEPPPILPVLTVDRREPWPHPWQAHLERHCQLVRGWPHEKLKIPATQKTGDFTLPTAFSYDDFDGEVIFAPRRLVERKRKEDWYSCCIQPNRTRFEDELDRMRFHAETGVVVCGEIIKCSSIVLVECKPEEARHYATVEHGMGEAQYDGTLDAWDNHWHPIVFAGNERAAAFMALWWLTGVMR